MEKYLGIHCCDPTNDLIQQILCVHQLGGNVLLEQINDLQQDRTEEQLLTDMIEIFSCLTCNDAIEYLPETSLTRDDYPIFSAMKYISSERNSFPMICCWYPCGKPKKIDQITICRIIREFSDQGRRIMIGSTSLLLTHRYDTRDKNGNLPHRFIFNTEARLPVDLPLITEDVFSILSQTKYLSAIIISFT